MKESNTTCRHCSRPFGISEDKLFFEEMPVCGNCYHKLTRKMRTAPTKIICPYAWLRVPAVLFALIGITGLLIAKMELLSVLLRYVNEPPLTSSYGVLAGAVILYGISLIRTADRSKKADMPTASVHQTWRSI